MLWENENSCQILSKSESNQSKNEKYVGDPIKTETGRLCHSNIIRRCFSVSACIRLTDSKNSIPDLAHIIRSGVHDNDFKLFLRRLRLFLLGPSGLVIVVAEVVCRLSVDKAQDTS